MNKKELANKSTKQVIEEHKSKTGGKKKSEKKLNPTVEGDTFDLVEEIKEDTDGTWKGTVELLITLGYKAYMEDQASESIPMRKAAG